MAVQVDRSSARGRKKASGASVAVFAGASGDGSKAGSPGSGVTSESTWASWPALSAAPSVAAGGPGGRQDYQNLLAELHALVSNGPALSLPQTQSGATAPGSSKQQAPKPANPKPAIARPAIAKVRPAAAKPPALARAVGGPAAEPEITEGATGSAVAALQQRLTALGFNPQGVDGIFGPNTLAAVRAFQAQEGIAVDGIVGPQTWGKLGDPNPPSAPAPAPTPAPPPAPTASGGSGPLLQEGATGSAVAALQQRLAALGFNPQGIDGDFGPNTLAAVRAFQAHAGITVDGIVGPQTWGRLGIDVGSSSPQAPSGSSPPGGFQQAVVAGADSLVSSGYIYPPNDTNQYYYIPDKVGCCADFVADSYGKAGFNLNSVMSQEGYNPHYCPSMVDYFKAHQQYIPGGPGGARVGDAVFFNWGDGQADHVAVVTQVDSQGRPTQIAESYNFNLHAHITNQVSLSNIMGFGRVVHT